MLELDYTNTFDSAAGAHGISKAAPGKAAQSSQQLASALESARTGGPSGFADLPFDEKPIEFETYTDTIEAACRRERAIAS